MELIKKIAHLKSNTGFIRYLNYTVWIFIERLLRIFAGFIVGVLVVRYLGPEKFGIYSYAIALVAIFAAIAKVGLDNVVVRELVNKPKKYTNFIGTAFYLKVIGAFFSIAIIFFVASVAPGSETSKLMMYIISASILFQAFEVVEFYFQSQVLAKIICICKVCQLILSVLVKLYLIFSSAELIWFAVAMLVDAIFLAASYFIAYWLQGRLNFFYSFDLSVAKKLFSDSWPLIFSSVASMIYMRIDLIMIKDIMDESSVGIYSAATKISESFYFIPVLISGALFPAIINAKRVNQSLYYLRLQRLHASMIWCAILIAIPVSTFSDEITILLFGEIYREAGRVLVVHVWAGVFVFLGAVSGKWYIAEGMEKLAFWRTFYGMVMNLILNFIMIPKYGLIGAAISTFFSQMTAMYLFDLFNKKTRNLFWLKTKSFFLVGIVK